MIQRLQSVFLLLVVVAMAVCLINTIWSKASPSSGETARLSAFTLEYAKPGAPAAATPVYYLAGLAVLSAGLALFSLLQYRNRLRQMMLGLINSLVMAALLGSSVYASVYKGALLFNPTERGSYETGFYAVVLGLIANILANRFIRRDEQLVRSADRMR